MINLSYNLSPNLENSLEKIENLRTRILLTPLSPNNELKLRWNAMIKRVHWSMVLHGNDLTRSEIIKLLSSTTNPKKKYANEEKEILRYKKALDYIGHEWLASERNVSSKLLTNLHDLATEGRIQTSESSLKQILDYLSSSKEHPVVKAGILQIALLESNTFTKGNGRTARLASYLLLYKFGYDFRGLLCFEEYFKKEFVSYKENVDRVFSGTNMTFWLEFFAKAIEEQLEKALTDVLQEKYSADLNKSLFDLNDRQKQILSLVEEPNANVTNKKVQQRFKVSQITASRDLSRLLTLGLLYAHGKGRSVYYTKA